MVHFLCECIKLPVQPNRIELQEPNPIIYPFTLLKSAPAGPSGNPSSDSTVSGRMTPTWERCTKCTLSCASVAISTQSSTKRSIL